MLLSKGLKEQFKEKSTYRERNRERKENTMMREFIENNDAMMIKQEDKESDAQDDDAYSCLFPCFQKSLEEEPHDRMEGSREAIPGCCLESWESEDEMMSLREE